MPKNTSFSLGEHFNTFIEGQVAQGRYDNASDVIRAALRLLEEQEAKLSALRAALVEGENSGPPTAFAAGIITRSRSGIVDDSRAGIEDMADFRRRAEGNQ